MKLVWLTAVIVGEPIIPTSWKFLLLLVLVQNMATTWLWNITEVIENDMISVNIATLSETRQFLVIDRKPGTDIWCLLSMGEECWNPVQTKSPAIGFSQIKSVLPQSNLCCVHDILPVFFNIPFP